MSKRHLTRRSLLQGAAAFTAGIVAAACAPKVIEVEKIVEREVPVEVEVEKVVKEAVEVEKEVTRVVEKQVPADAPQIHLRIGKFAGEAWDFDEKWGKKFDDENPNITVTWEDVIYPEMFKKCLALGATGLMWDCFAGHNIWKPYLAWQGLCMQLDPFVETHDINFEDFFPSVIEDATGIGTDGKLFWLPTVVHPGGNAIVGFNVDLMNEAGVELPPGAMEGEWTIADWEEMARKVTKPDEIFGLMVGGFDHTLYVQQYCRTWGTDPEKGSEDAWILSRDGRRHQLSDDFPLVKQAIEWYHGLVLDQVIPTAAERASLPGVSLFIAGACLSSGFTVGAPESLRPRIGDRFEPIYVPWPKGPSGHRGSCLSYNTMSVFSKTQYPNEAFQLCAYLTSEEPALYAGTEGTLHCMARRSAWFSEKLWSRPASGKAMEFAAHWFERGIDPFPQPWNLRFVEWEETYRQNTEEYRDGIENWASMQPRTQRVCQDIIDLDRP
jgi:ABC-type glycerol-3-phosphate transport system substrate-binding protein